MRPGSFTLSVQRGAFLVLSMPITNNDGVAWNLEGYRAKLRVYNQDRTIVLAKDAAEGTPTEELTVHSLKSVTVNGEEISTGTIDLALNKATTDQLGAHEADASAAALGPLRYQLDLVDTLNRSHRLLVGEIEMHEGVAT